MAVANRKISAAAARAHTRRKIKSSSSSSIPLEGMLKKFSVVLLAGLIAWSYQAIQPPPPRICGSPNGPPVTSSRITLKDGRHLAYLESGVPKEKAKYKIIYIHGFDSCRYDVLPVSPEVLEELGIYLLSFDRAGYGESDPNPKRSDKSTALDIEELADQLELGSRFHVIGFSMGGEIVWTCLKYIPHRLSGAAMLAPVSNYWWHGFPPNVSKEAYNWQLPNDKWAVAVSHYAPWLTYWWNTQKWFPASSVIAHRIDIFSTSDRMLLHKFESREPYKAQIRQQGEFESLHRDMMVGFGSWEFSPLDLGNPFPNNEGSVHLWHGAEDLIVPVSMSRFICQRLPWVRYHELPESGHMFPVADGMPDAIVKTLVLGDQAGYGESDANPRRTVKSEAMDIQELADQLEIGPKFYLIGASMGGYAAWSCLNYIPHRLAGAALVVPVINYRWPSFPANLTRQVYKNMLVQDQRTLWIAHHIPSLLYAWMTQKWLPTSAVIERDPRIYSDQDKEILQKMAESNVFQDKARQQGVFESLHRDLIVAYSNWEFDPMTMSNPFPHDEGTVHIWQGYKDGLIPVELQRYVAQKLPWIRYHEIPEGGHLFLLIDGWSDTILKALLLG